MKVKELMNELKSVDPNSDVIVVVYTEDSYESGYVDRVDTGVKYNSVTKMRIKEDDDPIVELTTSTRGKQ